MAPRTVTDSAAFAVLELSRAFRAEFDRRVAASSLPLTPAEARVLAHVGRYAPVRPGRLAVTLGMSKMSVSEFGGSLERAGYLVRSADARDRRAKTLDLTVEGRAVLRRIGAIGRAVRRRAQGDLDEADWDRFVATAALIRANLDGGASSRAAR